MSIIPLEDSQKDKLLLLAQSADESVRRRARLILAYAEGYPTLQASNQAGISSGRARYWKRQFLARGMSIFLADVIESEPSGEAGERLYANGAEIASGTILKEPADIQSAVEVVIPYPTPQKTIGLLADDSLSEAGKKVWLHYFAEMLSHEEGTLTGVDIEELHDMRVATRRLRTAFDIFGPAFDAKVIKRYLKGMKTIGRVLGQVRDMDVILDKGLTYHRTLTPGDQASLQALIDEWKQMIDQRRVRLVRHLGSEKYQKMKRDFNHFLQAPSDEDKSGRPWSETTSRLRDIVPVLVYSRYAAVRAYDMVVPTASIIQLHALRIEFKKFRYTLEYFREILGDGSSQAIRELKKYQDHLGELHDADVACGLVRNFLKRWEENQTLQPIQERVNPEPIVTYLAYLHAERYRLMAAFPALWQQFSRVEFRQSMAQAISIL